MANTKQKPTIILDNGTIAPCLEPVVVPQVEVLIFLLFIATGFSTA